MSGGPIDIYNGSADVFVTLKDDDSKYWLEVTTPQAVASHMDERKQRFLEPLYPFIIVRELTSAVIKEAIEAFIIKEEDGFWFKLYYSIPYLTIDDLNLIIDRHKKEMQAEEEKSCDLDDSFFQTKINLDRLIERNYKILFWVALVASGFLLVNFIYSIYRKLIYF